MKSTLMRDRGAGMIENVIFMSDLERQWPLLTRSDSAYARVAWHFARNYDSRKSSIMKLASKIEPNARRREQWFNHDRIAVLNNRTAKEILKEGMDELLVGFLLGIIRSEY